MIARQERGELEAAKSIRDRAFPERFALDLTMPPARIDAHDGIRDAHHAPSQGTPLQIDDPATQRLITALQLQCLMRVLRAEIAPTRMRLQADRRPQLLVPCNETASLHEVATARFDVEGPVHTAQHRIESES